MSAKSNSVDMVHGALWGKILRFTLLYMLTAILQHLYNAADTIVVGNFAGKLALGGVGASAPVINLCLNFIIGLSAGAAILLGQLIGANDRSGIHETVHTSIAIAVFGGAIMSAVCIAFARPLLVWLSVDEQIMAEALIYLRIVAIGFVPSLIYNFGSAIMRAKGDTKRPLYIALFSGVINVGLNLFFVCVFRMGAAGVAVATVFSQIFTAVAVLHFLRREEDETRVEYRSIRLYKKQFLIILKYGVPSGIQSAIFTFANLLVASSINSFGAAATAGRTVADSIASFISVINGGLYQACMAFSSQNYGAKQFGRIKSTFAICCAYAILFEVLVFLLVFFGGKSLIGLYVQGEPQVAEHALIQLRIVAYSHVLCCFMDICSGVLRGMGASMINMVTAVVGVCGLRIGWLLTAFKSIGTYASIFWSFPLSWGGTTILLFIMFCIVYSKEKKKVQIQ